MCAHQFTRSAGIGPTCTPACALATSTRNVTINATMNALIRSDSDETRAPSAGGRRIARRTVSPHMPTRTAIANGTKALS